MQAPHIPRPSIIRVTRQERGSPGPLVRPKGKGIVGSGGNEWQRACTYSKPAKPVEACVGVCVCTKWKYDLSMDTPLPSSGPPCAPGTAHNRPVHPPCDHSTIH